MVFAHGYAEWADLAARYREAYNADQETGIPYRQESMRSLLAGDALRDRCTGTELMLLAGPTFVVELCYHEKSGMTPCPGDPNKVLALMKMGAEG
ncbi:MAG: hypothetical protein JJU29_10510 [Verrucomicrobia bacterium]|nr:hypothetical protein [Verrucomicrobiota bacterium]